MSLLNGGIALTGKRGRKTANVCDASASETNMAAHFMFLARIRSNLVMAS
jgi:hypothetical protein